MESLEVRGRHETHTTETNRVSSGNMCEFQKLVCVLSLPPPLIQVSQLEKVLMSPSACHLGTLFWTDSVDIILLPQLFCLIKPYHKCPPTARQTNR